MERVSAAPVRAYTIEQLAATPSATADPADRRAGSSALRALADPLPADDRRAALRSIASALADLDQPPAALVVDLLVLAAKRDTETFEPCLPYPISAAYAANPADAARLVAELDTVADLIRA